MTSHPLVPLPVTYLYLDDQACARCSESGAVLEAAAEAVAPALAALGLAPEIRRRHVRSAAEAEALGFFASPTIRVAGRDIQPDALLSPCRECGELCGCVGGVDCRAWRWRGAEWTTVPLDLVVGALLAAGLEEVGLGAAGLAADGPGATRSPDGGAGVARFLGRRAGAAEAATPANGGRRGRR